MAAVHLVLIPYPTAGHLFSAVELAKLLVHRDRRLSITVFVMTIPGSTQSLPSSSSGTHDDDYENRLSYIHLSNDGLVLDSKGPGMEMRLVNFHAPRIRDLLAESTPLAGILFDVLCSTVLTDEIHVPRYVFCTSSAGNLCITFHSHNHDLTQFSHEDSELAVPGFVNPVPAKLLPDVMRHAEWSKMLLALTAAYKHAKGILVNTFFELESHAITSLSLESDKIPPIYPVGPIINFDDGGSDNDSAIIRRWLDTQPPSSILFVCFGSAGAFKADQVVEIARALERSGTRFLWSLRRSRPKEEHGLLPSNYEDVTEVLPEGFLKRTAEIGKVIGWAPQVEILSHPGVGGFISHCGWNSVLESLWFGVPIVTWPLSNDQQGNAFQLVKELEIAVELKLDYKKDIINGEANYLVTAEEIEKAIRQLMEEVNNNDGNLSLIKQKVKNMSKRSRMAIAKGGSSYAYLDRFIEDVIGDANFKT